MEEINTTEVAQAYFNNVQAGAFTEAQLQIMLLGLDDLGEKILTAYEAIKAAQAEKEEKHNV